MKRERISDFCCLNEKRNSPFFLLRFGKERIFKRTLVKERFIVE